jgi:hypothetical protein
VLKSVSESAIVNVGNENNESFKHAILSECNESEVDISMLTFPVSLGELASFEQAHPNINISVYKVVKNLVPVYLTKHDARPKPLDLILF